jgi:protoheme IX farnesyltransferase
MSASSLTSSEIAIPAELSVAGIADFWALMKPRVMSLVVFTGFVGYWLAPGHLHPVLAAVTILCIAIGAGASGAINMWYDRDIDLVMKRTRNRPIPGGRIAPDEVLAFGVILALGSVMLMGLAVNPAAAALLAITILFYVFIYTIWLKRVTPQNIVIGGAAGAFPPMIGWTAVTGDIGLPSLLLFALIFFWTPPHFWALALYRAGDYEAAGVPMLPVVAGPRETRRQMLIYTLVLWPVAVGPYFAGMAGPVYLALAIACSLVFTGTALEVWWRQSDAAARRMFRFSLLYLFLLFAGLLIDRVPAAVGG